MPPNEIERRHKIILRQTPRWQSQEQRLFHPDQPEPISNASYDDLGLQMPDHATAERRTDQRCKSQSARGTIAAL